MAGTGGGMEEAFRRELRGRYGGDREPSPGASSFAPDYPTFRTYARTGASRNYGHLRGDRQGRVYVHTPETIPIQQLDMMRFDAQIRAGLTLKKLPIARSRWTITCADKGIANLVQEILRPVWPDLIRSALSMLDWGYFVAEKLVEMRYGVRVSDTEAATGAATERVYPAVVALESLMQIDPLTMRLLAYNRSGRFAGFEQFTPETVRVPAEKAFHIANEMELNELYGVSALKPCYPFWLFKMSMYEWANLGFEKNSLPIRKLRYPEGTQERGKNQDGTKRELGNDEIALDLGEEMDSNNVIALPSSRFDEKGLAQWDAEFLANPFDGASILAYIDHLNAQILKGLLIPELALNVGQSGSYDLAQEQIRFFMLGLETLMDQIASAVSRQIVQPLVRQNCGRNAPLAWLGFQPLADDVKEGLTNVFMETVGQGQPIPLKDGSYLMVDWGKVAEDSGIPHDVLKEEDMALFRAAQKSNQDAMPQPDPAMGGDPSQGGQGGDMPFGGGPGGKGGPADRGGFGSPGGASKRPENRQAANPADDEPGEVGLAEIMDCWAIQEGELVWCASRD